MTVLAGPDENSAVLAMRAAKERQRCARLCVEDFLGSDMHFHPSDYTWKHVERLPANAAACTGKTALIMYDSHEEFGKTVTVMTLAKAAQNTLGNGFTA